MSVHGFQEASRGQLEDLQLPALRRETLSVRPDGELTGRGGAGRLTFVPRMICLSPGTKSEQRAYSHAMVRTTCSVALQPEESRPSDRRRPEGNAPAQEPHLFHTLTVSPEADRTARLSELKASVRTSVRWPPSVRRAVLVLVGAVVAAFRL